MVSFSLPGYHRRVLVTNHFRNARYVTVLWKSAQISSLMCLWKLTVATCVRSVRICKSSQSQVSSFHFSEYFVTEPVLVFAVRQLLRRSRIYMCQSCCYAGSTPGFLAFPKNGFLSNELRSLKWVKEIFSPSFLLRDLLADMRFKKKSLLVQMQRNKSNDVGRERKWWDSDWKHDGDKFDGSWGENRRGRLKWRQGRYLNLIKTNCFWNSKLKNVRRVDLQGGWYKNSKVMLL